MDALLPATTLPGRMQVNTTKATLHRRVGSVEGLSAVDDGAPRNDMQARVLDMLIWRRRCACGWLWLVGCRHARKLLGEKRRAACSTSAGRPARLMLTRTLPASGRIWLHSQRDRGAGGGAGPLRRAHGGPARQVGGLAARRAAAARGEAEEAVQKGERLAAVLLQQDEAAGSCGAMCNLLAGVVCGASLSIFCAMLWLPLRR